MGVRAALDGPGKGPAWGFLSVFPARPQGRRVPLREQVHLRGRARGGRGQPPGRRDATGRPRATGPGREGPRAGGRRPPVGALSRGPGQVRRRRPCPLPPTSWLAARLRPAGGGAGTERPGAGGGRAGGHGGGRAGLLLSQRPAGGRAPRHGPAAAAVSSQRAGAPCHHGLQDPGKSRKNL